VEYWSGRLGLLIRMDFDVFISHSTKDKVTADATCAALEAAGIRSWIAPRDVSPGTEYAAAIIDAIDSCRVMVVIVSSNANASHQIPREIERAASRGVPIVPMRIEEIVPTKSMAYFLGEIHWLDALTPPLTAHLQRLVETIQAILRVAATSDGAEVQTPPARSQQSAVFSAASLAAFSTFPSKPNTSARSSTKMLPLLASAIALVAVAFAGAFFLWQEQRLASPVPDSPRPSQAQPAPAPGPIAQSPAAPVPVAPTPLAPAPAAPAPAAPTGTASAPNPEFTIRRTAAFGGSGGAAFDDTSENRGRLPISAIRVVENLNPADTKQRILGSLQVRWGEQFGVVHGGKGPNAQPAQFVEFSPDEKVGRVDVNWMPYHFPTSNNVPPQWVAGLAIWTDSRVYSFGDMTFGPSNQCTLAYGEILLGFYGRSGSFIDQIGCVIGTPK
jgi:hypothetical protein